MPSSAPVRQYSPEPNALELRAADFLAAMAPSASPEPRALADHEVARLRRTEKGAVAWAAAAGVISGALIGGLELLVRRELMNGAEGMSWTEQAPYWAGFFVVAGLVSAVEIGFLYWNALKALGRVSRIGQLGLRGGAYQDLVALGLARAALEFPNPGAQPYGVNPYARIATWRLTLKNLLYKTKVGVSSFILRVSMRRVLGRMAVRGIVPLLAAPLYAVWNAIITWRLLRAARLRAMAPLAIEDRIRHLPGEGERVSRAGRQILVHGVGELLMRAADAHPSSIHLLGRLLEAFELEAVEEVDWEATRPLLGELDPEEREAVLDALVVAALLAERFRSEQREFIHEAHRAAGWRLRTEALDRLRNRLIEGRRITSEELRAARHRSAQPAR